MVDGSLTRLRLPGLRCPHWRLRLADDERATLRSLRPSRLREPLPPHARPPDPKDVRLATTGEADGRGACRPSRLDVSWLASRPAPGATRRARSRPSGPTRPRGRTAARPARRPLRELQRAEGLEPAAALIRAHDGTSCGARLSAGRAAYRSADQTNRTTPVVRMVQATGPTHPATWAPEDVLASELASMPTAPGLSGRLDERDEHHGCDDSQGGFPLLLSRLPQGPRAGTGTGR